MMVCFKYLSFICQSNLLHHDVHIQILEEQPACSGGGQEAEGTLAVVPQPDTGIAAITSILPLHAYEMALVQNFHLLYLRAHAELLGGVEHADYKAECFLWVGSRCSTPAADNTPGLQGLWSSAEHEPPPSTFWVLYWKYQRETSEGTPSWSS